jgi:hypothetical protein
MEIESILSGFHHFYLPLIDGLVAELMGVSLLSELINGSQDRLLLLVVRCVVDHCPFVLLAGHVVFSFHLLLFLL